MSLDTLKKYAESDNIAELLDEDYVREIGQLVLTKFDEDHSSMSEWLSDVKKVKEVASLIAGPKNYPLPTSANIKFPLITKACYEATSKLYSDLIQDNKIVKANIIGKDTLPPNDPSSKQATADRVCAYMNYQLLEKNTTWEQELDRLLVMTSLIGFVCKKTYYDPISRDVCSEICESEDLIINSHVRSLSDARRISHVLHLTTNDLVSASRMGIFLEEPVTEILDRENDETRKDTVDVIEQHCFLDLDDDNYEEPYIVTILKDTSKVLRIKARYDVEEETDTGEYKSIEIKNNKVVCIKPIMHFTDFHWLVNPKGKFQSVGFGTLLFSLNSTVNSLLNQLVDAGQISNLQGGFIDASFAPVNTGQTLTKPGEFIKLKAERPGVKLADGIYQFNTNEPSNVLMTLLSSLVSAGKDLASASNVMTGNTDPENSKTGATLAMIKEGQKLHNAIQKRIYRALTDEYRKIFDLNGKYLDPRLYLEITGDELTISKDDFNSSIMKVLPVADPNFSSDVQKAAQNQMLAGLIQLPGVNPQKITERLVMNLGLENAGELLADPNEPKQPNPEVIKLQADIEHQQTQNQLKHQELALQEKQIQVDLLKAQSEIILNRAKAMLSVAQADQAKATTQIDQYDLQLRAVETQLDHMMGVAEMGRAEAQSEHDKAIAQQQTDISQQQVDQQSAPQEAPNEETPTDGSTT